LAGEFAAARRLGQRCRLLPVACACHGDAVLDGQDAEAGERQGLAFPHKEKPDYWDFLYFSFNLGAAAQTSDVIIVSKRMHRLALAHTILAFAVNAEAGLI